MSIDREKRKKIFLTACICMSILSISFDTGSLIPWDIIKIKNIAPSDIGNTVISLQVTLVSTSIAIVAILSGLTNKKIYSKSVTEFITKDQPLFFKHRNIITALISLILVNYIFWVKSFYNCEFAVFIISLFLVLIMCREIFGVFYGEKDLKKRIKAYLLENYNKDYLEDINNDLLNYIDSGNTLKTKESLEILQQLFIKIISNNDIKSLEIIQNIYCDCYTKMFKTCDRYKISFSIKDISKIYEIAKDKQPILIWERCRVSFCKSLSFLQYNDLIDTDYIPEMHQTVGHTYFTDLHKNLYNNINSENSETITSAKCFEMKYFTRDAYTCIILNNKCTFSEIEAKNFCLALFYELECYKYYEFGDKRNSVILKEFLIYVSVLIDNYEEVVLHEALFNHYLGLKKPTALEQLYFFSTIIYCFYLIDYREDEFYSTTKKKQLKNFLISEQINIKSFLSDVDFTLNYTQKTKFQDVLFECELNSNIKNETFQINYVVDDFLIFVNLVLIDSEDNLINKFEHLIKKEEASFYYDRYFNIKSHHFFKHFITFYKLFVCEEIPSSAVHNNKNKLEKALIHFINTVDK